MIYFSSFTYHRILFAINPFSAETVFIRQNLPSVTLKELKYF